MFSFREKHKLNIIQKSKNNKRGSNNLLYTVVVRASSKYTTSRAPVLYNVGYWSFSLSNFNTKQMLVKRSAGYKIHLTYKPKYTEPIYLIYITIL